MHHLIEVTRSFRTMNTIVELVVCVPEDQKPEVEPTLNSVHDLFSDVERKLSRFRADSELSRLNHAAGKWFKASPLLFEVVTTALRSADLTGGIFDPTILPYLVSAGYDRSFEILKTSHNISSTDHKSPKHTWREIVPDPQDLSLFIPSGCSIDLGGIAKSWTVDRARKHLEQFQNYAINAGGDIIVKGTQTDGRSWSIGIGDPLNLKPNLLVIHLSNDAVCTSTTTERRWRVNGRWQHHLIDPRTGAPSDSGVISATVIARSAVLAEIISKAALILGPQEGIRLIESCNDTNGMLIVDDGSWLASSGWQF
jgi:FAD:protein FMN transferase